MSYGKFGVYCVMFTIIVLLISLLLPVGLGVSDCGEISDYGFVGDYEGVEVSTVGYHLSDGVDVMFSGVVDDFDGHDEVNVEFVLINLDDDESFVVGEQPVDIFGYDSRFYHVERGLDYETEYEFYARVEGDETDPDEEDVYVFETEEMRLGAGEDPIEDWYDLDDVRYNALADFELGNDLDEDTDGYDDVHCADDGFEPIVAATDGTDDDLIGDSPFSGTFDGNGYTIHALVIERESMREVGLFGAIDSAEISNLYLDGIHIHGDQVVGGIAGGVEDSIIVDSGVSDVEVIAEGEIRTGGFVGFMDGDNSIIERSFVDGVIISSGDSAAGFIGRVLDGLIVDSYSIVVSGDVANNVSGFTVRMGSGSELRNCYSVVSDVTYGDSAALLVSQFNSGAVLNDTVAYGDAVAPVNVNEGDMVGRVDVIDEKEEMQDVRLYDDEYYDTDYGELSEAWDISTYDEWDGETWVIDDGEDYPRLSGYAIDEEEEEEDDVEVVEIDPIIIEYEEVNITLDFGDDEELHDSAEVTEDDLSDGWSSYLHANWLWGERTVTTLGFDNGDVDDLNGTIEVTIEDDSGEFDFDELGSWRNDAMLTVESDGVIDIIDGIFEVDGFDVYDDDNSTFVIDVDDIDEIDEIEIYTNPSIGQYMSAWWNSLDLFVMPAFLVGGKDFRKIYK